MELLGIGLRIASAHPDPGPSTQRQWISGAKDG